MSDLVERLRDLANQLPRDRGNDAVDDASREAASRISQQDAELERLRGELADMTISRDGYAKQAMAREVEGRRKAFIEAAEIIENMVDDDCFPLSNRHRIAAPLRAKAGVA